MSLDYIRKTYNVPAEIGRAVTCSGQSGVIVGHNGPHIEVLLDKDKPGNTGFYHPTWEVVYGDMKPIRKMTRSQRRYREYLDVAECYDDFLHYLKRSAYAKKMGLRA